MLIPLQTIVLALGGDGDGYDGDSDDDDDDETWSRAICVSGVQLGRLVITTCQPGALQTTNA